MTSDSTGRIDAFPGFSRMYCLTLEPLGDKCFYADLEELPGLFELLRGEWMPNDALQAHWKMGEENPGPIARSTGVDLYLSSQIQQFFHESSLTGWSAYPVVLHNKSGGACPGYSGISIKGRCGPIDQDAAEVASGQKPGKRFVRFKGMYFDEATWDGSDFFMPEGKNAYVFVTERVKNLFEKHDIKGFVFVPLTEATWYP